MFPSHPRPEDLTALAAALSATADHCTSDGDDLLDHLVTVGDHATQASLESLVDAAVDVLRELSAASRELALAVGAGAGTGTTERDHERSPVVREPR